MCRFYSITKSGPIRWKWRRFLARAPVTNDEFAAFVDAGGTRGRSAGAIRAGYGKPRPGHSIRSTGNTMVRAGSGGTSIPGCLWSPMQPSCMSTGMKPRLLSLGGPSIAHGSRVGNGRQCRTNTGAWRPEGRKRRYPWGDEPPTPERANLEARFWAVLMSGPFQRVIVLLAAARWRAMSGNGPWMRFIPFRAMWWIIPTANTRAVVWLSQGVKGWSMGDAFTPGV